MKATCPTAVLEFLAPDGSLGDLGCERLGRRSRLVEAFATFMQQMGADMAQKIAEQLVAPQRITAGGKTFTFSMRPARVDSSVFADAAQSDTHGLSRHGHPEGFSQPRAH